MVKVCEKCGNKYFAVKQNQRFCCKNCRISAEYERKKKNYKKKGRENPKTGQICWRCQRACGKCSWSRFGILPDGCVVRPSFKKEKDGYVRRTYRITMCPKFLEDEEESV